METCDNIEEKLYYGSICKRVNVTDVDMNHMALVKNPKDRRCVITKFEIEPGNV
ncbi:MAG: hypothetical protein K5829_06950 [Treponema sp.]|nr:hypothetical protein [Treponema sp.]